MGSGYRGSSALVWIVLTVVVAAAIPIIGYLLLSGSPEHPPTGPRTSPALSVNEDLQKLARDEELFRESVSVILGDLRLVEAIEVRKEAGSGEASARTMLLRLEPLLTTSRGALDDAFSAFFDALPPGTESVRSDRLDLRLTGDSVRGPGLAVAAAGVLRREEGAVSLVARWRQGEADSELELSYTLTSGLLFVRLTCPGLVAPAAFLPPGTGLALEGLTLTSGNHLELVGPRLVQLESGAVVAGAERFVFSSPRAVERPLLAEGLPAAGLARLAEWQVAVDKVSGNLSALAAVPAIGQLSRWPDLAFRARQIVAGSGGRLELSEVSLEPGAGESVAVARAAARAEGAGDQGVGLDLTGVSWRDPWLGLAVTIPVATLTRDGLRVLSFEANGFTVGLPGNPLAAAQTLAKVSELMGKIKEVRQVPATLSLPPLPPAFPELEFALNNGTLTLPLPGEGRATLSAKGAVRGGSVERFQASACLGSEAGDCGQLELALSLGTDALGRLKGVRVKAGGPSLARRLAPYLPEPISSLDNISLECHGEQSLERTLFEADCKTTTKGLTLFHKRLAPGPILLPHLYFEGRATVDTQRQRVELSFARIQLDKIFFRLFLELANYGKLPSVKLTVDFPEQKCEALRRSLPRGFADELESARLEGVIWFKGNFEVDFTDVRKSLKLELDGDLERCDALTLGPALDVAKLNRPDFVHRVVVNGEDLELDVGPGTTGYVPLAQIPKVVQAAAWGTEDIAFDRHNGFRLGLIRRALILYLERGYFAYGGSTISQQLVKNLFLWRTKDLSRKFQEAVIVWKMEKEVSKERILELYINCIEYGPKIWGISKAARVYFGKHPSQLNAIEAAFIMGLKPDPGYGYLQFRRGKLNSHWRKNLDRVLKRMQEIGAISVESYQKLLGTQLQFRPVDGPDLPVADEDRPVPTGQEELEEL